MVLCLALYHPTVTNLTKCKLLRMIFHEEDFEINVCGNNTVLIYIWNMEIRHVWKAAHSFEAAQVSVGYGFGNIKKEAKELALLHLNVTENKQRNHNVEL